MKNFGKALGLSILLGIAALVLSFPFIEGWGSFATVLSTCIAFILAGFFVGKKIPGSVAYAGMFLVVPYWLASLPMSLDVQSMVELLISPRKIDYRTFYVLLPPIALFSAYTGSYMGFRISKGAPKSS